MNTKICTTCGSQFIRKPRVSLVSWERAKYCSMSCVWKANVGKPNAMRGRIGFNRGKKVSEESRKKMSLARIGCAPWNKGLGTHRGFDHRRTRAFRELRVNLLIRAEYRCNECGAVNGRLEIDHIKPVRFYPELVLDETNMRVLCRECHKKTSTYGVKVFTYGNAS